MSANNKTGLTYADLLDKYSKQILIILGLLIILIFTFLIRGGDVTILGCNFKRCRCDTARTEFTNALLKRRCDTVFIHDTIAKSNNTYVTTKNIRKIHYLADEKPSTLHQNIISLVQTTFQLNKLSQNFPIRILYNDDGQANQLADVLVSPLGQQGYTCTTGQYGTTFDGISANVNGQKVDLCIGPSSGFRDIEPYK